MRIPITVALALSLCAAPAAASSPSDGIWQTDGYGQYVRVHDDRIVAAWDTTAVSCVRAEPGDGDPVSFRRTSPGTATEHIASATSVRVLRRGGGLPARCGRAPRTDPRSVFDTFWATFAENYPFFALHHVDWDALRARYRPQVTARTTPAQLRAVFTAMLTPLHDAHVALLGPDGVLFHRTRPGTPDATPQLDAALRDQLGRVDLPSVGGAVLRDYAKGRISAAELPGRVGYLRVSGFAGYTDADTEAANRAALDRALDAVFTSPAVARWRGLMIDLRVNGGGSDALALRLAGRLADHPYRAYSKQYWDGHWSRPQPATVRPAAGARYGGRVTVLTSGANQSAGETFTQALLGRASRPTIVGQPGQGVFSDTLDRSLPNGWTVVLPNERYVTCAGRSYDGRGVPVDVSAPLRTSGPRDRLFAAAYAVARG